MTSCNGVRQVCQCQCLASASQGLIHQARPCRQLLPASGQGQGADSCKSTPLCAASPSESSFLGIYLCLSLLYALCVLFFFSASNPFLRRKKTQTHIFLPFSQSHVGRTRVWVLAYDWQVQAVTTGRSWVLHVTDHVLLLESCNCSLSLSPCSLYTK